MLKLYRNISYLFIGILVLAIIGFYWRYFSKFPSFDGLPTLAHLHAAAFLAWFALLIAQPILIRKKKLKWHRRLGKISYFLVPLIVLSIFGMMKFEYLRDIKTQSKEAALSGMTLAFLDMSLFTLFYVVAMVKRKKLPVHVSFVVASSLVLLGPGMGRLIVHLSHSLRITSVVVFGSMYLTLIVFMVLEKRRYNRPILRSPYLLILGLFMLEHTLLFTIGNTAGWQWFADKIVKFLF